MNKTYIDKLAYIHLVDEKLLTTLSRGKRHLEVFGAILSGEAANYTSPEAQS